MPGPEDKLEADGADNFPHFSCLPPFWPSESLLDAYQKPLPRILVHQKKGCLATSRGERERFIPDRRGRGVVLLFGEP